MGARHLTSRGLSNLKLDRGQFAPYPYAQWLKWSPTKVNPDHNFKKPGTRLVLRPTRKDYLEQETRNPVNSKTNLGLTRNENLVQKTRNPVNFEKNLG